jgi:hypothetical protein
MPPHHHPMASWPILALNPTLLSPTNARQTKLWIN